MNLAKFSLALTGLAYLVIGIIFLFDPVYWGSSVDIALPTPTAIIDLRATYGGCMFAIAVFLFYCLSKESFIKIGLIFQAVSFAGFGITRLAGIVANPPARGIMYYLLIAEILGVALAVYCLSRLPKTDNI